MRAALLAALILFALPVGAIDKDEVRAGCEIGTQEDIKTVVHLLNQGATTEQIQHQFRVVAATYKMDKDYREAMLVIIGELPDQLLYENYERAIKACVALYVEDVRV